MQSSDWSIELRRARTSLGLSRRALARFAGISGETIKAYELGRRRPSRAVLRTLVEALQVEQTVRNRILVGAGFAPEGPPLSSTVTPGYAFTLEEATEHIEQHPWPAAVVNEVLEIVVANRVAQRLSGVDLSRELPEPLDRNLLALASNPRFADRIKNWDEAFAAAIAMLKVHHRGPETRPEGSGAYFSVAIQRFVQGDPAYVRRFLELWDLTPPGERKVRWSYPVVWEDPDAGVMRFKVLGSMCNERDALQFQDWIPLDAATWEALERLKAG